MPVAMHRPARLVINTPDFRIYQGTAEHWHGDESVDFVFTNPYGPLPESLHRHPMIIHQWLHRKAEAEQWCGNSLNTLVSLWNHDKEAFWSANVPKEIPLNLSDYVPVSPGWYPEDLVRQVFDAYIVPGSTVWDGFMGRGTIAKIAREFGVRYIGVEMLPQHIAIACRYLNLN
jgi:hypothetical protein